MTAELEPDDLDERRDVDPRSLAVRISRLKLIGKSPAHYREACRYGDGQGETLSLKLGNAADAIAFGKPHAIWNQRTATGKLSPRARTNKAWVAFQAEHAGQVIMTPAEESQARGMVDSLRNDLDAYALLFGDGSERDVEVEWTCLGRRCVSHLDAISPLAVTDLKTCESAEPARFVRRATWYGYHAQKAFYVDACRAAGLGERESFIVAVESKPPYPVTVLRLTDRALEQGRAMYRGWMERLLACEAANEWPGYAQSVVDFDVEDSEATLTIAGEEVEL